MCGRFSIIYQADIIAILTTQPNGLVAPVHNRMPVILLPEYEAIWLCRSAIHSREIFQPYPADSMCKYPVSKRINSPKNDDPSLIEPTEGVDQ